MIAHVVLYEFRSDLDPGDQERLHRTVQMALASIPSVRRWMVGRRITLDASYEALMETSYGYAAVLEFEDRAGLRDYLEHPLHADVSRLFWSCSARTIVFDYDVIDSDRSTNSS
jgi:hypothetical protein